MGSMTDIDETTLMIPHDEFQKSETVYHSNKDILTRQKLKKIENNNDPSSSFEAESQSDAKPETSSRKRYFALFLCVCDIFFFGISFISVQYLSGAVPENELNSWRFAFTFVAAGCFMFRPIKQSKFINKSKWHIFSLTAVCSVVNNITLYSSTIYLPVGASSAISTAVSIIGNAGITVCVQRAWRPKLYIGALISVFGILFVIQPTILGFPEVVKRNVSWVSPCLPVENVTDQLAQELLGGNTTQIITVEQQKGMSDEMYGTLLAAASGLVIALNYHTMHWYVDDSDPFVLVTWRSVACTLISLVLMGIIETPVLPSMPTCILSIIAHGLGVSVHSTIIPYCLQSLSPAATNLINSLNLTGLVVLQYSLMRNIIPAKENWMEVCGAILCVVGASGATVYEVIKQNIEDRAKQIKMANEPEK